MGWRNSSAHSGIRVKNIAALLLLFLMGCGHSPDSFPEIASTTPEDGSERVFLIPEISVSFSIDIDPATISGQTFTLVDDDGAAVESTVSYDGPSRTATLVPTKSLEKRAFYTAMLGEEIKDIMGKPFGRGYSWSFRTSGLLFIVLSDTHIRIPGAPDDRFYDNSQSVANLEYAVSYINSRYAEADFVIVTGDLVGGLFSADPALYGIGLDTPADRFKSIMDNLSMPYHVALGNHDYLVGMAGDTGEGIGASDRQLDMVEAVWKKLFNIPPYYAFDAEGIRFYMLNSVTGSRRSELCPLETVERMCRGSFSNGQIDWLENDLAQHGKAFFFFHHPVLVEGTSPSEWAFLGESYMVHRNDRIYDVLSRRAASILGVFTGHGHFSMNAILPGGTAVYETPSLGDMLSDPMHMNVVNVLPDTGEFEVKSPL